jgi:hypothetical protein
MFAQCHKKEFEEESSKALAAAQNALAEIRSYISVLKAEQDYIESRLEDESDDEWWLSYYANDNELVNEWHRLANKLDSAKWRKKKLADIVFTLRHEI